MANLHHNNYWPPFLKVLNRYYQNWAIFKIQTAKYVYKCLHNLNPSHLNNMFTYVQGIFNTAATRNQELLIPLARTKRYGCSILNIGSHSWNNIPLVICTKATTKLFTKALSIHLITCYNNN